MERVNRSLWGGVFALMFLGGIALADTVVLCGGKEIEGELATSSDSVSISSENGTLTIPLWRVAAIRRGNPGTVDEVAEVAAPRRTSVLPGRSAGQASQLRRSPEVLKAVEILNRKMSVDFVATPLRDALSYIQEMTGGNFSAGSAVDAPGLDTVTLRLNDVRVRQILEVMLEPAGLAFSVSEGGVIRVDTAAGLRTYHLRVYDVRDLLSDVSDKAPGGREGARQGRQEEGGYEGSYTAGQWGGEQTWGGDTAQTGVGGGDGEAEVEDLADRADSLAQLIMATVAPGTWVAGGVIGGPQRQGGRGQGEQQVGFGVQTGGEAWGVSPAR